MASCRFWQESILFSHNVQEYCCESLPPGRWWVRCPAAFVVSPLAPQPPPPLDPLVTTSTLNVGRQRFPRPNVFASSRRCGTRFGTVSRKCSGNVPGVWHSCTFWGKQENDKCSNLVAVPKNFLTLKLSYLSKNIIELNVKERLYSNLFVHIVIFFCKYVSLSMTPHPLVLIAAEESICYEFLFWQ